MVFIVPRFINTRVYCNWTVFFRGNVNVAATVFPAALYRIRFSVPVFINTRVTCWVRNTSTLFLTSSFRTLTYTVFLFKGVLTRATFSCLSVCSWIRVLTKFIDNYYRATGLFHVCVFWKPLPFVFRIRPTLKISTVSIFLVCLWVITLWTYCTFLFFRNVRTIALFVTTFFCISSIYCWTICFYCTFLFFRNVRTIALFVTTFFCISSIYCFTVVIYWTIFISRPVFTISTLTRFILFRNSGNVVST